LYGLGDLQWRLGNWPESQHYLEECLALAHQIEDVTQEITALNRLGGPLQDQGKMKEAKQVFQTLLKRAREVGHRLMIGSALNNLCNSALLENDFILAQEYGLQALVVAREIGHEHFTSTCLLNLAYAHLQLDELLIARRYLIEGTSRAVKIGLTPLVLGAISNIGLLVLKQGKNERGLNLMGMALFHPASFNDVRLETERKLSYLKIDISDPEIAAQLNGGRSLNLETVVAELLVELEEMPLPS
jgi:tetratricopeptide (TPR) repeat protein